MRQIIQYTRYDEMDGVWEGTFDSNLNIEPGDFILTHHLSKFNMKPVVQLVMRKQISHYFNDVPIYDYIVECGSAYKSNLKLISIYDRRIS